MKHDAAYYEAEALAALGPYVNDAHPGDMADRCPLAQVYATLALAAASEPTGDAR